MTNVCGESKLGSNSLLLTEFAAHKEQKQNDVIKQALFKVERK